MPLLRDACFARVPRRAGERGIVAFIGALAALLVVKSLKLPAAQSTGVFSDNIVMTAWGNAWHTLTDASLPGVLVTALFAVIAIRRLAPSLSAPRTALATLAAVYALALLVPLVEGSMPTLWPPALRAAPHEAKVFAALFWRDLCTALLVGALIGVLQSGRARWRAVLTTAVALVFLLLLAFDSGYFAGVRTELSTQELAYAVASPRDAFIAARDGWSPGLLLPFCLPVLAAIGAVALAVGGCWLVRRFRPGDGRVAVGPWIWLTLGLAALAPSTPLEQRMERFASNILVREANDLAVWPLRRWLTAPAAATDANFISVMPAPSALRPVAGPPTVNVVLLLMESARVDAVSTYNPALSSTPSLARLAQDSLQVDEMYAVVPRTSAAWIASLAGLYPAPIASLRAWTSRHPAAVLRSSLAALLRPFGYRTAFFTPTRLRFENDERVIDALGFQTVLSGDNLGKRGLEWMNSFGYADEAILPLLGDWLDEQSASKSPFLLTVMTNAGHFPYGVPREWGHRVASDVGALPKDYLNAISYADHQIGQILGLLEARGLLDTSLVIVMGDHGEAFNEHGIVWHASVPYREGLQIPAFLRLPASARRTGRISGPRQQIDLAPTVAEVLGLEPVRGSWAGASLLRPAPAGRDLYFGSHFDELNLGLLSQGRRYVYFFDRKPMEVFDAVGDRSEAHPLMGSVPPASLTRAEAQMRAWYDAVRTAWSTDQL